jgi:hypothetical protein
LLLRSLILAWSLLCLTGMSVEPEYAKWGNIAMEEAAKQYNASIVDYKHLGRTSTGAGEAEEAFQLWLRGPGREFGIIVTIRFKTQTDEIVSIRITEMSTSKNMAIPKKNG